MLLKLRYELDSNPTLSRHYLCYLAQLNSDAELRFPDGDFAIRTPALVLHHVLTQAFHHKGQIANMAVNWGIQCSPLTRTSSNEIPRDAIASTER
jgi:uncharacterized damage-inducible protein DinB